MSIGQIPADGGIQPLKDSQINQMAKNVKSEAETKPQLNVEGDSVELSDEAKLFQEVEKYKKEIDSVPSPNEGRIQELRDSIANGTFLTEKAINETADRISEQLLS